MILSILALAIFMGESPVVYAAAPPTIEISGSAAMNPYGVYTSNGEVFLPIRWVAQELGAQSVEWDEKTKTINIKMDGTFDKYKKFMSYVSGLTPTEAKREEELCPLSDQAKKIALPALRQKVLENVKEPAGRGWITGGSSPWAGPITLANERKLSETMVEYTIRYPEVTSAGSTQDTGKMIIEKQSIIGKEGWFITRLLFGNSYYSIISAESQPHEELIKFVPLQ